jgi:hypothetical protein
MACGFGFYALAFTIGVAGLLVLTVLGLITHRGRRQRDPGPAEDQASDRPADPFRFPRP